jgi:putative spermidine/putrescine transport system substrate-binding protein
MRQHYDSNLSRRELLRLLITTAGGALLSTMPGCKKQNKAVATLRFYGLATLNIEDWSRLTKDTGIEIVFTDNGNDPGPVVTQMTTGIAATNYDVGGLQGGAEPELAAAGKILPWDLSKLSNWSSMWDWAKAVRHTTYLGKQYGLPTVINADSMIYRPDMVANVDSYAYVFDPKLKKRTSMEDAWINSVIFAAIFLKENSLLKIADPGDLTPDELGGVMQFLTKHKRDGQFIKFWKGWEDGLNLISSGEVAVMTGWEPIQVAAKRNGINAAYAKPREGYEGWSNDLILHTGAQERGVLEEAHRFANWEISGSYGVDLALKRGYVVPCDSTLSWLAANPSSHTQQEGQQVTSIVEGVKQKFFEMGGRSQWQNVRPTHYKLYEQEWSKLRAVEAR